MTLYGVSRPLYCRYLFLTFDDPHRLSLDDWVRLLLLHALARDLSRPCLPSCRRMQVMNTECHPLRLPQSSSSAALAATGSACA